MMRGCATGCVCGLATHARAAAAVATARDVYLIVSSYTIVENRQLVGASRRRASIGSLAYATGCGTMRIYGRGASQPSGYTLRASSSDTEPTMITLSPCVHCAGVATLC